MHNIYTNGCILPPVCNVPMGIANHLVVKDQQLSASSSRDQFSGAERARLDTMKDGSYTGGWVAGWAIYCHFADISYI